MQPHAGGASGFKAMSELNQLTSISLTEAIVLERSQSGVAFSCSFARHQRAPPVLDE